MTLMPGLAGTTRMLKKHQTSSPGAVSVNGDRVVVAFGEIGFK
jgi:hypothetical protein